MENRKTAFVIIRVTLADKKRLEAMVKKGGYKNLSEMVRPLLGL